MKINILYKFVGGPWGGGNQFLKSLKKYFTNKGCYVENPQDADVILFNSHHELLPILKLKRKYPEKIFIHRVDGPVFYIRGSDLEIDRIIFDINKYIADGTIFQSEWSRNKNYELGMRKNNFETIIMNAPDPDLFYPQKNKKLPRGNEKIKLIATSWAPNIKKGFDIYEFLDDNLDFGRYEMTFVGRSPIKFKQIQHVPPQPSGELAEVLRQQDIFITASRNDPCSN
ncbi:glycosyltransferase family 1 protein, partial [bacterium]|nr:glycosyltransferase family 1 protein [bacterium]